MTTNEQTPLEEMGKDAVRMTSNTGNNERGTPRAFVRKLMEAVGGKFDLDPCSGAESHPIAENRFTKDDNGLAQPWHGTVYVNPPYGDLKTWMKKSAAEADRDETDTIICLVPGYTSTQWFQKHAAQATLLCLVEGRLTFGGCDNNATFPSVLLAFGDITESVAETFNDLGALYTRVQVQNAAKQQRLTDLFGTDGGAVPETAHTTSEYPTQNTTDQSSLGPTIRDLAQTAPPNAILDFGTISVGDDIYVELDTDMMGFPSDVPEEMHTRVLCGAPATPEQTLTPDNYETLLCIHEPTETYVCLYQHPNTATDIRCTVAPEGYGWDTVHLNTIQRIHGHDGPLAHTYIDHPDIDASQTA